MASWKRPPHFVDQDRDGETSGNKSKRRQVDPVPTQTGGTDVIEEDKLKEKIFGPMIRKVVGEEVANAFRRYLLHLGPRVQMCSGQRRRTLHLRFKESPGETYTGVKVEAKNRASLEVALYQCGSGGNEDRIVTEGPLSSTRIELCVLQGNFGSDGREDWSSRDFHRSILNQTRKKGKLLTGDLFLRLTNGIATVENLCVNDISNWAKSQHFRLGAKVAEPTPETEYIREGISQPFRVKDCRGLGYQKHETPSLNDEIWRLPGIRKDGKIQELLQSKGIQTVGAFLLGLKARSNQLKQDLREIGVGEKTWKKLTLHATKASAKQDARLPYLPPPPLDPEPQLKGLPQHELLPAAPQGLSVPSTSTSHFSEAVHIGQLEGVTYAGDDIDFSILPELLGTSSTHEGHSSHQSWCPNSGVYISSRGSGTTIWSQIRSAFQGTWTWLHLSPAKRKRKFAPITVKT